ncbi:hypothetical protein DACRYDRAFT_97280 [Dacryopinax primogenitus]|uniref:Uncharacterized protein n=1 Tax=Dacryopinax primogenitus (strain DJM 731) TaxID=1858805 RepID=M5FPL3_DACPD|nr:uncharacterized protein DACRYDRAFT_97280 [Dacryopinax primogenitus]EJT97148.1 hypothetical protein DACRYDRAFT_97280 [Dacryopinax primogenitus]
MHDVTTEDMASLTTSPSSCQCIRLQYRTYVGWRDPFLLDILCKLLCSAAALDAVDWLAVVSFQGSRPRREEVCRTRNPPPLHHLLLSSPSGGNKYPREIHSWWHCVANDRTS